MKNKPKKEKKATILKELPSPTSMKNYWLHLCSRNELSSKDNQSLSLWEACKLNYSYIAHGSETLNTFVDVISWQGEVRRSSRDIWNPLSLHLGEQQRKNVLLYPVLASLQKDLLGEASACFSECWFIFQDREQGKQPVWDAKSTVEKGAWVQPC